MSQTCGMNNDHYYSVTAYERIRYGEAKWALADMRREVDPSSPQHTHPFSSGSVDS